MYNAETVIGKIDEAIKAAGTTKAQLCRDTGISKNTINSMTDKKGISSFDLARIADYLGVSVDDLLDRKSPDADSHIRTNDDVLREQLQRLSDESLIMLRDYTRYLLWLQNHPAETAASEGFESLQ
jgi:DNA-binding Xre family transcriptional regulator